MSQENVEIVKANYAAFAQGGIDQWLEHWADDLDFQGVNPGDERPIHGKDGLRAHIQEWIDTFDDFGFDAVELFDAGPDTVVSFERFGGRARISGVEADQVFGVVFTIRDGKIAACREYATTHEALDAAGLRE